MKKNFLSRNAMLRDNNQVCNRVSAQDLEDEAGELSNFGGGMSLYTGNGDQWLDFAGNAGSFADPAHRSKTFTFLLANASTTVTRTALLCPGLIPNAVGLMTDGAFNDITGTANLSGSSQSPGTIAQFNAYIQKFPSAIVGMKIACSNVAQMDQSFSLSKESPFRTHSSKIIATGVYASENNLNTTILSIPEPFFMDAQTKMSYAVAPSTTVAITLFVGTSLNTAKALREKAGSAKRNIQAVGGPAAVAKSLYIGG